VLRSDFGRQIDLDISTAEKEYDAGLFPLDILFEPTRAAPWKRGYRKFHHNSDEKMDLLERFEEQILMRFQTHKIPVIVLDGGSAFLLIVPIRSAACHIPRGS
jgi:hypothetical protein